MTLAKPNSVASYYEQEQLHIGPILLTRKVMCGLRVRPLPIPELSAQAITQIQARNMRLLLWQSESSLGQNTFVSLMLAGLAK